MPTCEHGVYLKLSIQTPRTHYPIQTTWTEIEERRRVWWAIFILDRLVATGSKRPCVLPEPTQECRLPSDDTVWDSGQMMRAVGQAITTPYQVAQSSYARLCQAAVYLGRALNHARNPQLLMNMSRITEVKTLVDELGGFNAVVDAAAGEIMPDQADKSSFIALLGPRCVARSAVFVALEQFSCPEKMTSGIGYDMSSTAKSQLELELQSYATQCVQLIAEQLHGLAMKILSVSDQLGTISPLILDSIYASAVTFHWILGETGTEIYRTAVEELDTFMEVVDRRWRSAGRYREIARLYDISTRLRASS